VLYRQRKIFNNEYELDIFLPDYNIGIEVNGLFWHCEKVKNKYYHLNKHNFFKERGIRIINIFDDEIDIKLDIIKSRLLHILNVNQTKIYARKCIVKQINKKTKKDFINKHHIQGDIASSYNYGLYYDDILISVMTFANRKIFNNANVELTRYCCLPNYNIIGGAGKLLNFFLKEINPHKVISYCDRCWSEGNLYKTLGFKLIKTTPPNYTYTKNFHQRFNRMKFQKHKLSNCLEIFDKQLSETQNMHNNGYYRIWDCGSFKFELSN
jgi:hypothetical protein